MTNSKLNLGVDVGGTFVKLGIIDENGKIVARHKIKTQTESGSETVIQSIIEAVELLLKDSGVSVSEINAIGMGFPGTTDLEAGVVLHAPNIFWKNVDVVSPIKKHFQLPVYIGQDSRAAAWAEYLIGVGKGFNYISSITLGTGIGCGLVLNGKIYHGGLNTAGEFGHQIIEADGIRCNCGGIGCLESYIGGPAVLKAGLEIENIEMLTGKPKEEIAVMDIFDLAKKGNAQALEITNSYVKRLGIGMVNLINLTSLELISISGGISNAPDELLFNPLTKFVKERAYSLAAGKVKVIKSTLGDDAPLIGAAMLYLS
ncbi:MAG: ROK family protein [Bacteroidota bacterium]